MSWLRQFKVWHRLLAAGLMLCIPLAILAISLVKAQNVDIAFARKEIIGVEHLTAAFRLVSHIQQHRGLARRWLDGDVAARRAADQTAALIEQSFVEIGRFEQRHGNVLDSAEKRRAMEEQWLALRQDWHRLGARVAWSRHVMLVDSGLDLIRHLGNTSNLILDPAIGSYYLADIAVNKMPAIADHIGHLRGVGSGAAALGALTPSARDDLRVAYTHLQAEKRALDYNFAIILGDGDLKHVIGQPLAIWREQLAAFETKVERQLRLGDWVEVDSGVFFDEATAVIGGANALLSLTSARLVEVLEARIVGTEQRRNQLLAGVLVAFLTAVVLGVMLVKSVTRPLARAIATFRRIQNGHYDTDIDLDAGGEPLEVLRSLAAMQDTLGTYLAGQQRDQAALREAYDDLERRVRKRTADLTTATTSLIDEVAERKRVEEELQRNRDLLAVVQDSAKLDLWVQYTDGRTTTVRSGWMAEFLGVPFDTTESSDAKFLESVHLRDRDRVSAVYDRFWRDRNSYAIEYDLVSASGDTRTVYEIATNVKAPGEGGPVAIGSTQDISERKEAEAALRDSEEMLERAQAVAQVGSWRWSVVDDKLISCSDEYARIHGVGPDQISDHMAEQMEHVIHPDDREQVEAAFRRYDAQGADFEIEYRIVRPDGEVRHVQEIGKAVLDDSGRAIEQIGTVQDITDRTLAEQREAEAHDQLIDAIESISDGFVLLDSEGRLVLCNSRFREFYSEIDDLLVAGADFESIVRQSVERGQVVVPLDDSEGWLAMRFDQFRKGRGTHEQLLAGGRWVQVTEHRTSSGGVVGIRTDITERRRTEEALWKNRVRLTNAQRIAKLGHWELELDPERLLWSDELFNVFQVERKDFDGTTAKFYERVHPDDREQTRQAFASAYERGVPFNIEHRILLPDGTVRHIRETAELVADDRGKTIQVNGTAQDVTERKSAEERFRSLLESAPDAMIIVNNAGTIVLVNAQTEALFGYARTELLGKRVEMLMPKARRSQHRKHRAGFFGKPRVCAMGQSLGLSGLANGGREFPVEISLSPIETEDGLLVSATVRDITARMQAEQALRHSESRLQQAQEIARIGHFAWDEIADEVIYRSDVIYEIYGVTREDAPATVDKILMLVHPDDRERVNTVYENALGKSKAYDIEFRVVHPDGEVRYVHELSTPEYDDAGAHVRSIGTFQDITESQQAEQALRDSEERFRVVMDNSPEAVTLKDAEGRYRLINRRFEEWYGIIRKDTIGKTVGDLFSDVLAARSSSRDSDVLRTGRIDGQEIDVEFADGSRHQIVSTKFPVFDADGIPVGVGTIDSDVTEQRHTETQLRQAQKMEAVGQLTGGVAHDFNNLLAVIAGNLELLDEAVEGQPEAQELLRWAIDAADDAATLTQRLLAFSRRQPLQPRVVEVNDMVLNLLNLLSRALGDVVAIETTLADNLWSTLVDGAQLESAVLNLVINARDAMLADGSGSVTIETANVVLDSDFTEDEDEVVPGDYVMLTVSDTGHGMTPEVLGHAFEPFYTTKRVGEGSGLGLSMVYGFSKQSGGHAKIYSEEGHGTAVRIYLPRAVDAAEADEVQRREPDVRGDGQLVLVVEDDEKVRGLAVKVITALGYRVCEAEDGATALEAIDKTADIDVMLTDVILPGGMSGRDIADEVAVRRPEVGIIFTSGYSADAIIHDGKLDEGVELLSKPYRREALAQALRRAVDGVSAPVDPVPPGS